MQILILGNVAYWFVVVEVLNFLKVSGSAFVCVAGILNVSKICLVYSFQLKSTHCKLEEIMENLKIKKK